MSSMEPSGGLTCPIQSPVIAGVRCSASLLPSYASVQGHSPVWPVWAKCAVQGTPFSVSKHLISFCTKGHVCITQLGSEPDMASSLASLCLRSCKHDFLVRMLGLRHVWSRLSLVTIFAKKYRLDYDKTSHSGHSISRSRLEVGWDECVPCPVPPLFCREKLCLGGVGVDMELLKLANFLGGGSDLIAISSWEKKI